MNPMLDTACTFCGERKELRPYGPKGERICFDCMTSTPELESAAKQQFIIQLEASGPVVVIGTEVGPHPIERSELRRMAAEASSVKKQRFGRREIE